MSTRPKPPEVDVPAGAPAETDELELGRGMRRTAGTRRELTDRVTLRALATPFPPTSVDPPREGEPEVHRGWVLNISRGGVRVVLESTVALGAAFDITVGEEEPQLAHVGRVVWVQKEPDGVVAGLEFVARSTSERPKLTPDE